MKKFLSLGLMALMMLFAVPNVWADGDETEPGGETPEVTKLTLMVMSGNDDNGDPILLSTDNSNEVGRYMAVMAMAMEADRGADVRVYYTFDADVTLSYAAYEAQTDGKILLAEDTWGMGMFSILTNTEEDNLTLRAVACLIEDGAEVDAARSDVGSYALTFTEVDAPTFANETNSNMEIGDLAKITNASSLSAVYTTGTEYLPTYANQDMEKGVYEYYNGISIQGTAGSTVTIKAINYDMENEAGSKMTTVTYNVIASTNTFTFTPAASTTDKLEANTEITVVASKGGADEGIEILYKWFATEAEANVAEYGDDWKSCEDSKPQATNALPVLRVVATNVKGDVINYGTAVYAVKEKLAKPTFTPEGKVSVVDANSTVTINATTGATVRYQKDGGEWAEYTAPIAITENCKLRACAIKDDMTNSDTTDFVYFATKATFTFSPAEGETVDANDGITVTASKTGTDVTLYYKWFATKTEAQEATEYNSWNSYSESSKPQATQADLPVLAVALEEILNDDDDAVAVSYGYAEYTVNAAPAVTLTFTPASESEITEGTAVTITASTEVEAIYYMMFASKEAAEAAEWNQDAAKNITDQSPVPTKTLPTIKAAYALPNATAVADNFFYATYTVKDKPALVVTFNPASGSAVEENTEVTITVNRTDAVVSYVVALDSATAYATGATLKYPDEDGNPVIKKDYTYLRCNVFVDGETKYFNATYTIKEKPVDPNKLDVKIEFMTDAYGQARFAKSSDKIRLVPSDEEVDSMFYAVAAVNADDEETTEATYAKYGEDLISLEGVDATRFMVKAYAMKANKYSDTVKAIFVMVDSIKPFLKFDTATGKNYPVAFNVRSVNYPDVLNKDLMVYYTTDGKTEPSDTAFLNQEGDAIKYLYTVDQVWSGYLELTQNTTVWAKAYVMVDNDAQIVVETPVVKQLVKVTSLPNPVITPAVASTEYNAGDSIKVAIEAPEGAEFVYYTLDGSEPLFSRTIGNEDLIDSIIFAYYPDWGEPFDTIVVKKSTTIKAIAYREPAMRMGRPAAGSDIVSATFGFKAELTFDPASGSEVYEGTKVAINSEDETIDIYYMMFESEEAAKAAEWNQDKAELYTSEMQPVITKKNTTIKAAYLHTGATAVTGAYFYATYTVKERPAVTLTLNPADGAEVEENTKITVTASRELGEDEFIMFKMFATKKAADTIKDEVMVVEASIYGDPKEDEEFSFPVITKAAPVIKVGMLAGMDENGKWIYNWVIAEYKIKGETPGTAIEAGELAGVNVYPNPSNGSFNVAVPERARIDIFGLNGAKVMSREANAGVESFNIDRSGIYFVRVMAGNKMAVKRVVVR